MGTKDGNGSEFADCAIGGAITGWVSWKVDNPYNWILIGRAIQGIGALLVQCQLLYRVLVIYTKTKNKLVQV